MGTLPLKFYRRDTEKVAQELLGKVLYHKIDGEVTAGIITETEAYLGLTDPACHTYKGRRTNKTECMYLMGGHSYIYFIYGIHFCFNVVTLDEKRPEAVLIRALKPIKGLEIMRKRRKTKDDKNLCSGPGKLCQAMKLGRAQNGLILNGSELKIVEKIPFSEIKNKIQKRPRVGIPYAGEAIHWPLRFSITL